MGLTIVLETERGEKLEVVMDPANLLHGLLPQQETEDYKMTPVIDWYGDTVFNRLQVPALRREFQKLKKDTDDETRGLVDEILELFTQCEEKVHHYVKFYGD